MEYTVTYRNPQERYLHITLKIHGLDQSTAYLHIPCWRPGRYELANYAANIRNVTFHDHRGSSLEFKKVSQNKWEVPCKGVSTLIVNYQYYAFQLDAGGSLLDDQQLYLNFINCLLYLEEKILEPCSVKIDVPQKFKVACGLPKSARLKFQARNYHHLVDSPLIASSQLEHWKFRCKNIPFHLWFMGAHELNKVKAVRAFKAFIDEQIRTMGGFPEKEYHFLFEIPKMKMYHGVEHANSTVIVLGPGQELHKSRYYDFLGVSSHELFHAWNVLKIRPKELLPYDFSRATYFDTGFIAEGITTYYGDLFLVRSKVFDQKQYFKELDTLFKRHFENTGRFHSSLIESSRDLWVDGYKHAVPSRKVSIYTKGALVSLILDLTIRKITGHKTSLDDVMRHLWRNFGKKNIGYSLKDFQNVCEQVAGQSLNSYFKDFIYGTLPIEDALSALLDAVGCKLKAVPSRQLTKKLFGFRTITRDQDIAILQIASGSPAYDELSIGDVIISINGRKPRKSLNSIINPKKPIKLVVNRQGRDVRVTLKSGKKQFFKQYRIVKQKNASGEQKHSFCKWLGSDF